MDLVAGVKRCVVTMDHTDKAGNSKLLKQCTLPLTGKACVHRIITNLGVFDVVEGGLKAFEIAPGVTREEIEAQTEAQIVSYVPSFRAALRTPFFSFGELRLRLFGPRRRSQVCGLWRRFRSGGGFRNVMTPIANNPNRTAAIGKAMTRMPTFIWPMTSSVSGAAQTVKGAQSTRGFLVLFQPRHDLDEVAGLVADVELPFQDAVPAVLHRAGRAGQGEEIGAVRRRRRRRAIAWSRCRSSRS